MRFMASLVFVLVLCALGAIATEATSLRIVFGAVLPAVAIAVFLIGIIARVVLWARTPVPFAITTTCGQQKSLDWIKADNLEAPHSGAGVLGRMALEVLLFRSLFRNTRTELSPGGHVTHGASKWLWLAALVFHYCFLIVALRHLRLFSEPVPGVIVALANLDGFFEVGTPALYLTGAGLIVAVAYLLARRLVIPSLRYISLAADYFPLLLLLGIAMTGLLLRHWVKTDVVAVKEWALGLSMLQFAPPAPVIHALFYVHLCLVCALLVYFPFSKLLHAPGVFLSPTRNLRANSREVRHVNPWNYPVSVHTYDEYEEEFREKMIKAGIPLDKAEP